MIQQGPLDIVAPGDAITAELHNQPKHVLRRMGVPGPAQQVIGHPIPEGGTGSGIIDKFRIMNDREFSQVERPSVRDDFFYATRLSTDETRIKVAKPNELRTTPWDRHLREKAGLTEKVWLDEFDVYVTYVYPHRLFAPLNFDKRWATRDDEPNIRATQIIWPAYWHAVHIDTPIGIIKAVQIGEEATGIEGVEWEDIESCRTWTVFPAAFRAEA